MTAAVRSPAIVIIGRNEGDRLKCCLASLPQNVDRIYVDSGSTDGSQSHARSLGVTVIDLDREKGFTAARARNAGLSVIRQGAHVPEFVQMVDGDCELDAYWLGTAAAALEAEPGLAAVFGRRRERFPEHSLYNRQCDEEWNVPLGYVASCGGDAMFRLGALSAVGDYRPDLIAGEEPDLCLRLAQQGWSIKRIDAEMTIHDVALIHFSQWWRRSRRAGYAYTEHVWRNGIRSLPNWRRQVASILLWGGVIPIVAGIFLLVGLAIPLLLLVGLGLLLIYPVQLCRIAWRNRTGGTLAFGYAALIVVGKFAEAGGAVRFLIWYLRRSAPQIIEYKSAL